MSTLTLRTRLIGDDVLLRIEPTELGYTFALTDASGRGVWYEDPRIAQAMAATSFMYGLLDGSPHPALSLSRKVNAVSSQLSSLRALADDAEARAASEARGLGSLAAEKTLDFGLAVGGLGAALLLASNPVGWAAGVGIGLGAAAAALGSVADDRDRALSIALVDGARRVVEEVLDDDHGLPAALETLRDLSAGLTVEIDALRELELTLQRNQLAIAYAYDLLEAARPHLRPGETVREVTLLMETLASALSAIAPASVGNAISGAFIAAGAVSVLGQSATAETADALTADLKAALRTVDLGFSIDGGRLALSHERLEALETLAHATPMRGSVLGDEMLAYPRDSTLHDGGLTVFGGSGDDLIRLSRLQPGSDPDVVYGGGGPGEAAGDTVSLDYGFDEVEIDCDPAGGTILRVGDQVIARLDGVEWVDFPDHDPVRIDSCVTIYVGARPGGLWEWTGPGAERQLLGGHVKSITFGEPGEILVAGAASIHDPETGAEINPGAVFEDPMAVRLPVYTFDVERDVYTVRSDYVLDQSTWHLWFDADALEYLPGEGLFAAGQLALAQMAFDDPHREEAVAQRFDDLLLRLDLGGSVGFAAGLSHDGAAEIVGRIPNAHAVRLEDTALHPDGSVFALYWRTNSTTTDPIAAGYEIRRLPDLYGGSQGSAPIVFEFPDGHAPHAIALGSDGALYFHGDGPEGLGLYFLSGAFIEGAETPWTPAPPEFLGVPVAGVGVEDLLIRGTLDQVRLAFRPPLQLDGGAGDDTLGGGAGDDRLFGFAGADLLFGGAGDDRLDGGEGDDVYRPGAGRDVNALGEGADLVVGTPEELDGDRIEGLAPRSAILVQGAAFALDALSFDETGTRLGIDLDGDGAPDMTLELDRPLAGRSFAVVQEGADARLSLANAAPVAVDDAYRVLAGDRIEAGLLFNDRDDDPEPLQVTRITRTEGTLGALEIDGYGHFRFTTDGAETLAPGETRTVRYVYRVEDPSGAHDEGELSIEIRGADQPPLATDDGVQVAQGGSATLDLLANDLDPEGGALTLVSVGGQALAPGESLAFEGGTLTRLEEGRLRVDAPAGDLARGEIATRSLDYAVADAGGGLAQATLTVTLVGANAAPAAADDALSATADGAPVRLALLANDADPDGDALSVVDLALSGPSLGALSVGSDGEAVFTPAALPDLALGETAETRYLYTVSDGFGGLASATLHVSVAGVAEPPAPTASPGSILVETGDATVDALLGDDDGPGVKWGEPGAPFAFTYSFVEAGWTPPEGYYTGGVAVATTLSAAARDGFRAAAEAVAAVARVTFEETTDDDPTRPAHLRIAAAASVGGAATQGFSVVSTLASESEGEDRLELSAAHGDIWIRDDLTEFGAGSSGLSTLVHELLHSLGLSHPFEGASLPEAQEDQRFTVLSYDDSPYATDAGTLHPGAPQLLDIAALQHLYGANAATGAGDDLHAFDGTAIRAIWDAGGLDAISAAALPPGEGARIDLRPGALSSIGAGGLSDNIAIARGVEIETAIGSAAADEITGNALGNRIEGGGGFDLIRPLGGADLVILSPEGGVVAGTPEELDGDRIEGFGVGSRLQIEGVVLDPAAVGVSASGEAITLDLDGDGAPDVSIALDRVVPAAALSVAAGEGGTSIARLNLAPTPAGPLAGQSAIQDQPFAFTLPAGSFTDDGDAAPTLSATLADGGPLPAWLDFVDGRLSGTPGPADVGALSLRIVATDAFGAQGSGLLRLVVEDVNDAPTVAAPIADRTGVEHQPFALVVPAGTFADPDAGDAPTLSARLADGAPLPGWLDFDPAAGRFSGTPGEGDAGALTLRLTATDRAGASVWLDFALTVAPVDDLPVAADDVAAVVEDAAVSGDLLANDRDPEGDPLRVTRIDDRPVGEGLTLAGGYGELTLAPDGTWRYVADRADRLAAGERAEDVFLYRIEDAAGGAASARLVVEIEGRIDREAGGKGRDRLTGGAGDDLLLGRGGADRLIGRGGDDDLRGGGGGDVALGGPGRDALRGDAGSDLLKGAAGADMLSGGGGRDRLLGGRDADLLRGGGGRDRFELSRGDGADTILDWQDGKDRIVIASGAGSFDALEISRTPAGAVVAYGREGDRLTLQGVAPSDLDASDFLFG